MKKLIILLFLSILSAHNIEEITKMIQLLKEREVKYIKVGKVYDPFYPPKQVKKKKITKFNFMKEKKDKVKKKSSNYNLEVIFGNKVKISGQWYKIGQMIGNHKIIRKEREIFLKNGRKYLSLKRKTGLRIK